jgi:putative oxidoreductase
MIVAAISVHLPNGLFATTNGIEVPLLYATSAFGLALVGYGPYSLDRVFGITSAWTPKVTWIVLAVGVVGGVVNLLIRQRRAAAGSA